jgi:hypothetical protein
MSKNCLFPLEKLELAYTVILNVRRILRVAEPDINLIREYMAVVDREFCTEVERKIHSWAARREYTRSMAERSDAEG